MVEFSRVFEIKQIKLEVVFIKVLAINIPRINIRPIRFSGIQKFAYTKE